MSDDASSLGSSNSGFPALFNAGSFAVGLLLLCSSVGITRTLLLVHARRWAVWAILLALVSGSIVCFNAGLFPLPDERHTSGPLASIGMAFFFLPFVLPFTFRRTPDHAFVLRYFWLNLAVLFCLFPIVSGLIQRAGIDIPGYQDFLNNGSGALQRIAAGVVFIPCGVLSWYLLQLSKQRSHLVGHDKAANVRTGKV